MEHWEHKDSIKNTVKALKHKDSIGNTRKHWEHKDSTGTTRTTLGTQKKH